METISTTVCIIGAGPAGIVLGNILLDNQIDCVVVDKFSQQEIYDRGRAGLLESTTVEQLDEHDLATTIFTKGAPHGHCEFRIDGVSNIVDYNALAGGDSHYIYPQSDLNDDLIERYKHRGGKILFKYAVDKITQDNEHVEVHGKNDDTGQPFSIHSNLCAGCDGYHGASRSSIPDGAVKNYEKQYPHRWLTVLAEGPPPEQHIVYGVHSDGFAAHMPRTETVSRYYLEVKQGDTIDQWTDERIWETLNSRLKSDEWTLNPGKIVSKSILKMRSYVMEPLQFNRLIMAGDAAHIITPSGGKGLNLAVQDAVLLAKCLISYLNNPISLSQLDDYSKQRLAVIWKAQEFSRSLLLMLHTPTDTENHNIEFLNKLRLSKLSDLLCENTFSRDFSRNYVGII